MKAPFEISSLLHSGYQTPLTRSWQEDGCRITSDNLMFPIFMHDKPGKEEIKAMPGQYRYGIDVILEVFAPLVKKGLKSVLIFGVPGDTTVKVRPA